MQTEGNIPNRQVIPPSDLRFTFFYYLFFILFLLYLWEKKVSRLNSEYFSTLSEYLLSSHFEIDSPFSDTTLSTRRCDDPWPAGCWSCQMKLAPSLCLLASYITLTPAAYQRAEEAIKWRMSNLFPFDGGNTKKKKRKRRFHSILVLFPFSLEVENRKKL